MTPSPNEPIEVHYLETKHGYFPELVRLMVALSSIGLSLEIHKGHLAPPYGPTDCLTVAGKGNVSGVEISFFVAPIYQCLLNLNEPMPKALRAIKRPINHSASHPLRVDTVQSIVARLVADAFLSYYERYANTVKRNWEKAANWPMVWEFARVVRKAIAHNGKIYFKDEKATSVHWQTLTYSPNDNDLKRQLLYDEITGVKLILLMEDMDSILRAERDANAANEISS